MNRKLLTAEGYKLLKDELQYLHRTLRPKIIEIVSWIARPDDRSENAGSSAN